MPAASNRPPKSRTEAINIYTITTTSIRTFLLCNLLLTLVAPSCAKETQTAKTKSIRDAIQNFQCDYYNDACKLDWQMDGECDGALNLYNCLNNDCWDCDPAQTLNYNCSACVEAGAYWCPTDGICLSQPIDEEYWNDKSAIGTCTYSDDWKQSCEPLTTENVFTDPLYDAMAWSYRMINVEQVWKQGITGSGVHVRINDVGIDAFHAEFANRFDFNNSCSTFVTSTDANSVHGTGVASILAANANNNECAVGIAPNVTFSGCTFREDFLERELVDMLESQTDNIEISSNSWGPEVCTNLNFVRLADENGACLFDKNHESSPCEPCQGQDRTNIDSSCSEAIDDYCTYYYRNDPIACAEFLDIFLSCEYHSLPDNAHTAFVRGALEGRNGKGIIYVWAGGNSHEYGVFTNTDGFVNSRFTIAVGAVGRTGQHASYSTTGSALHVTAPGGDLDHVANNVVARPGGGCQDIIGGTSFSAPVVSGVIALMLEANPLLGWRDVQSILAHTSQKVDASSDTWTINGANMSHSYKYGFGIVDAAKAVEAAKKWTNVGTEKQLIAKSQNGNLTIADDEVLPTIDTIDVEAPEIFVTESVVVYLNLLHASRGDLKITLTSPSGTASLLHPSKRPENQQLGRSETWKFMTVRNWGEDPNGQWKITLVDERAGDQGKCANLSFEHVSFNKVTGYFDVYNCLDARERVHCWNGAVRQPQLIAQYVDEDRDNRTAAGACCDCGGGTPVSDINLLLSWTVVVYGHETTPSVENGLGEEVVAEDQLTGDPSTSLLTYSSTVLDGRLNNTQTEDDSNNTTAEQSKSEESIVAIEAKDGEDELDLRPEDESYEETRTDQSDASVRSSALNMQRPGNLMTASVTAILLVGLAQQQL